MYPRNSDGCWPIYGGRDKLLLVMVGYAGGDGRGAVDGVLGALVASVCVPSAGMSGTATKSMLACPSCRFRLGWDVFKTRQVDLAEMD